MQAPAAQEGTHFKGEMRPKRGGSRRATATNRKLEAWHIMFVDIAGLLQGAAAGDSIITGSFRAFPTNCSFIPVQDALRHSVPGSLLDRPDLGARIIAHLLGRGSL
jgi:hypothetical protein